MPEISVIIPVFNVEKYLYRCVESVLCQSYRDIEIILVDDGSTDHCPEICDAIAETDGRVKVIHKANGGLSSARNAGIDMASADFIVFVDSDDWVDNNIYENALKLQRKYDADIVEFGFQSVHGAQPVELGISPEAATEMTFGGVEMLSRMYQNNAGGSVVAWNKLYRKSLFLAYRFEVGKIHEDTLIMPKLFFTSKCCVVTDVCGYYYYRDNENSITHAEFSEKSLASVDAHRQNRVFYQQNNLVEAKLWCDTTYAFVMINALRKINTHWGKRNVHYRELKKEYKTNFRSFMKNPYFIWKQKLLLFLYYFTI